MKDEVQRPLFLDLMW